MAATGKGWLTDAPHVAIFLRWGIGDLVMELPVLRAVRQAARRAKITAIGASPATQLLEDSPDVDEVISVDSWGVEHLWDEGSEQSLQKIRRWIDQQPREMLCLDLLQAPPAVANSIWERDFKIIEADQPAENRALAEGRGAAGAVAAGRRDVWVLDLPRQPRPHLEVPPWARREAEAWLRERGASAAPLVAFSSAASLDIKRWPIRRLQKLVSRLRRRYSAQLVAISGSEIEQEEWSSFNASRAAEEHCLILHRAHLLVAAGVIRRAALFIGNDTGMTHIAAAVGAPTVALYGPTSPDVYAPRVPRLRALCDGSECGYRVEGSFERPLCSDYDRCLNGRRSCVDGLTLQRVAGEAETLIQLGMRQKMTMS